MQNIETKMMKIDNVQKEAAARRRKQKLVASKRLVLLLLLLGTSSRHEGQMDPDRVPASPVRESTNG